MTANTDLDRRAEGEFDPEFYKLRLYIVGNTSKSTTAVSNLKRICEQYIPGQYEIEVLDLAKNPKLAISDGIMAIPTLVRTLPEPVRRIIGDLSSVERVLIGMDVIRKDRE